VAVYGGFAGTETARSQRNWTDNPTTLSGDIGTAGNNSDNAYHVVLSVSDGNATVLDGFTVTKGNANNQIGAIVVETKNIHREVGGGMYDESSNPTLANCTFFNNTASSDGGGMYNKTSSPALNACVFSGNSAAFGAGMENTSSSNPTLANCMFLNNTASGVGGGLENVSSSPALTACVFSGNTATLSGGGMINSTSNPTLTNCLFSGNSSAGDGGGMLNASTSHPTLTNCTFSGNKSTTNGGGLTNYSSTPVLKNCIIWNNREGSTTGSATASIFNSNATPTISYSLIQNHNPAGTGNLNGIPNAAVANYPLFVTPLDPATAPSAAGDFHLSTCSPVLNLGTNTGAPTTDLFGNARPFGTTVDLGVHELQSALPVPDITCPANQTGVTPYTLPNFTGLASASGACTPITITQSPTTGTSLAIGVHTITLTATAGNGATATCTFTVTVNSNCPATGSVWYVDGSAASGGTGSSWTCAFQNLQNAIDAAGSGHEIWVKSGTYKPTTVPTNCSNCGERDKTFYLKSGVAIYGGYDGSETLRSQRDWAGNVTTLSGDIGTAGTNSDNCFHVVLSISDANTTVLDGFTVSDGNANGSGTMNNVGPDVNRSNGGGIHNKNTSLVMENCIVSANLAAAFGAGIYASNSPIALTNSTVSGNTASNLGGGVYNTGSAATFTGCTISGNTGSNNGGGMTNDYCSPTITDCDFLNNTTTNAGGGMLNFSASPIVTNCTFSNNSAVSSSGGGVSNYNSSCTPTFDRCIFSGNTANSSAGMSFSQGTIKNCLFSGNSASGSTGALSFSGATMTITNCTFSGNSAASSSGGITFGNSGTSVTLTNCLIWNNRLDGVTGSAAANMVNNGSILAIDHSLIQNHNPAGTGNLDGIPNAANSNYPGFVTPLDPATAPSAAGDFHLSTCSPVQNLGTNSGAPTTDLFGNARPFGTTVDMGVHELQSAPPVPGITCPANQTGVTPYTLPDFTGLASASGACTPITITQSPATGTSLAIGMHTITLTATAGNGATATCTFTVTVNSNCPATGSVWYVDGSAASGGTGTSWTCAFQNLQDAIDAAGSGHEIWVKAGTYKPTKDPFGNASPTDPRDKTFYLKNGVAIYGGFNGSETARSQRDWAGNVTTLSGDIGTSGDNADNCYHVVLSASDANTTELDGFTVSSGNASGTGFLAVESKTINRNQGGGLYNHTAATAVKNCTFLSNSAASGGGAYNASATSTYTGCLFSSNSTTIYGGGVYNTNCTMTFNSCTFSSNTAGNSGGGMRNETNTSVTLNGCIFKGNSCTSSNGGGFYIGSSSTSATLTNCLFSGNSTGGSGGGIYNSVSAMSLTNCTVSGNKSTNDGGGIAFLATSSSEPIVKNCLVWNNRVGTTTGSALANLYTASSTPVISYSLIQNHNPAGTGNLNGIPNAAEANYPLFVTPLDPATAPSAAGDFQLTACSPVQNKGDNTGAPATDLFGNVRPFGSTVDMGVHERQEAPTPAVATCQNTTVQLDGAGNGTLAAAALNNGSTGCTPLTFSASQTTFNCADLGPNLVTLTVTGANSSTSTCTATVTVADQVAPNALCRDFVKNLGANGTAGITAAEVDNLSNDNCGTVNLVSALPNSFICSNIGANTVTLTVNDGHGNSATCNATVTIADATPPTAICQNIAVNLNAAGTATLTAAQVNNGSTDNCGIGSLNISPNSFTCANVGAQTVALTVTDVNNLTSTCNATVTVSDNTNPTAICQNVSVNLGTNGTASITAAQVNNGSSDNCGIGSLAVSSNSFTCANIGANSVTLTATDNNGRTNTCAATVTVADAINPTSVCQNITVNLDANGNASITGAQVDGGSTDNCGIAGRSVTPNTFTTGNLGANTVTLTVTDNNNLTATCTAVVTVTNTNLPNAVCQPYTAVLGANGSATITAANVDGGSTAVGGIASMSVSPGTLTCANIGTSTVTLTVTGNNGQTATCNAGVTVQDNTAPTAVCQNVSVNLSGSTASVTAAQILNLAHLRATTAAR
jgi:hypothetical protein